MKINTPICDFLKEYECEKAVRLHMPGHKGVSFIGCESHDITEVAGADSLYHADGIIKESEKNASVLFGTRDTVYSAEGSSLAIRAMMYLAKLYSGEKREYVLAGRNAHSSFITAAALVDYDIEWLQSEGKEPYIACTVTPERVHEILLKKEKKPIAVYITSPDYLGNICDIEGISKVCRKFSVPLLVDNAHGAYLKFLSKSQHPIDLGADMCCDSAHKTLPVLTGGAYLHISESAPIFFSENAKSAMALFGSTSPSYLILESLDRANKYISENYSEKLQMISVKLQRLKDKLTEKGYVIVGNEKIKLTVNAANYGYSGYELSEILAADGIVCEFCDPEFVVFMFSPENTQSDIARLEKMLLSLERKAPIRSSISELKLPVRICSVRDAIFAKKEKIPIHEAIDRVLASVNVTCPPAVSLIVAGEKFNREIVEACNYYGFKYCDVIIE